MHEFFATLGFIVEWWAVIVTAIVLLAALALVSIYLPPVARWLRPVLGFVGFSWIMFLIGRKSGRDNLQNHYDEIQDKREKAYAEIDSRGTDSDDVRKRLHDAGF